MSAPSISYSSGESGSPRLRMAHHIGWGGVFDRQPAEQRAKELS